MGFEPSDQWGGSEKGRALPSRRSCKEFEASAASIRLVHFDAPPTDIVIEPSRLLINLTMTPRRNARACYARRWGSHRFVDMGDMIAIPPGEPLRLVGDGAIFSHSIICEIDPEVVEDHLGLPVEWTDRRLEAGLSISSAAIQGLLRRLVEEVRTPGFASKTYVDHVVGLLAIELARYWDAVPETRLSGGMAAWRLRIIDDRLKQPGLPPSLRDLADACGMSVRQLTRAFRMSRGISIGQSISESRLRIAKAMLLEGHSVKAIAHQVGFSSSSSFSCAFRQETGLSPSEYVKKISGMRGQAQANLQH